MATNQFGPGGGFMITNPIKPSILQSFYTIKIP